MSTEAQLVAFKNDYIEAVQSASLSLKDVVEIKDENHKVEVELHVQSASKLLKQIKEHRMAYTRPLDDAKKRIMAVEKEITATLSMHLDDAKTHIGMFNNEAVTQYFLDLADIDDKFSELPATFEEAMKMEQQKNAAIDSLEKPSGVRMIDDIKIVDPDIIPREFMKPDEEKIKLAISAGLQVKGVVIFKKAIRSGRV